MTENAVCFLSSMDIKMKKQKQTHNRKINLV